MDRFRRAAGWPSGIEAYDAIFLVTLRLARASGLGRISLEDQITKVNRESPTLRRKSTLRCQTPREYAP